MGIMNERRRRFAGLKDLIHDNVRQGLSAGLTVLGDLVKPAKQLIDDDPLVTLQCGKAVVENTSRNMRTELWMSSLHRKGVGVAAADKYDDMLLQKSVGDEVASDIDKDLARTFPSMRRFASRDGLESLRRVLLAYAAYDPEVGYCQGMNFVAGLLLMYLPERHAFGGLVVLMQDRGLRKYYSVDMSLLQTHLWQLGRLMPQRLCAHLEACGVLPLLYGASWLMTCFSADFPASFSARVMDVIMADKMDQALLKAAVGLLRHCEQQLLQLHDMEDILQLLKLHLPNYDESVLHDVLTDAFKVSWSPQQLQLLGSTEGSESVAEALQRVQRANKEAAAAAAGSTSAAADNRLSTVIANSRPSTTGSEDTATPCEGDTAAVAAFRLMPPPSPTSRPLSRTPTQRGYDSDRGVEVNRSLGSSPGSRCDRGFAGPWSDGGLTPAVADLLGPEHTVISSSPLGPAGRVDHDSVVLPSPLKASLLEPNGAAAAVSLAAASAGDGRVSASSNADLIDISSPRASSSMGASASAAALGADNCSAPAQRPAAATADDWDPFGMSAQPAGSRELPNEHELPAATADHHAGICIPAGDDTNRRFEHIQQPQPHEQAVQRLHHLHAPQLRLQLEELSFSHLSCSQLYAAPKQQQQPPLQQQQHVGHHGAALHALEVKYPASTAAHHQAAAGEGHNRDDHDWWDFQSSPLAHDDTSSR